jgi:hypothetical protein
VLALAGLLVSSCSEKPKPAVLATVGNANITLQDFQREVEWRTKNQYSLPEKQALLDEMIARELRLQKARSLGLDQDADLRRHYDSLLIAKLEQRELKPRLDELKASAEEVRSAYDKDIARYTHSAKVRLAVIFIKADARMGAAKFPNWKGASPRRASWRWRCLRAHTDSGTWR